MSLRQDFIQRAIQKFAEAIARALGLARGGQPEEGLSVIDDALASGLGLPVPMLLGLTPDTVWSLLGPEKSRAFAEALRTRALILDGAKRTSEAVRCEQLAEALEKRAHPR
ncbi:MAG TPA: hypothetical protein VGQ57_20270 [Polyangiaceae bacterium]|jgi:hypothetical protein|nr:hypothetical protein [Polyangiaceae bacterium]